MYVCVCVKVNRIIMYNFLMYSCVVCRVWGEHCCNLPKRSSDYWKFSNHIDTILIIPIPPYFGWCSVINEGKEIHIYTQLCESWIFTWRLQCVIQLLIHEKSCCIMSVDCIYSCYDFSKNKFLDFALSYIQQ